jgi:single-stranded-DNA-specific exonuclease
VEQGRRVDERVIGWKLGPRLNAPGRLGDAEPALALLLAEDPATAARWAERLDTANQQRRAAQDTVLAQALEQLGDRDPGPAVVVAGRGWPCGVVGVVAAKLVDLYRRPALVIAIDPDSGRGRGSARGVEGIDLYKALEQCADTLERFGGHTAAAGITVRESAIDRLREILTQAVVQQREHEQVRAGADVDAEVALAEVDERLCQELGSLAPFGKGNEEPLLMCRGMRVRDSRRVGDGSHLKLEIEDGQGVALPGIAFGLGDRDPGRGATIDAAFAPVVSEWRGRRRVELEIRRLNKSRPAC